MKQLGVALLIWASGVVLGAIGYHLYLSMTPSAARPYVAVALEWADREAEREALDSYARNVFTASQAALAEDLSIRPADLPTDCSNGYHAFAYEVSRSSHVASCNVSAAADGRITISVTGASGRTSVMGPW